jgi:hypothetical protein
MDMERPLALDHPTWSELTHAYGSARDIPELLVAARSFPNRKHDANEEPWFSLWSALAHQGDVYTASYAAAEHLALDAVNRPSELWLDRLNLVFWIEHCRMKRSAPAVPDFLTSSYDRAKQVAHQKLADLIQSKTVLDPVTEAPYLLQGIAALRGWRDLSDYLNFFPDGPPQD